MPAIGIDFAIRPCVENGGNLKTLELFSKASASVPSDIFVNGPSGANGMSMMRFVFVTDCGIGRLSQGLGIKDANRILHRPAAGIDTLQERRVRFAFVTTERGNRAKNVHAAG
jgi:hypothetical protein